MTARANSLTERVTNQAGSAGPRWTAPATEFRVFVNSLARLGYNVDSLLVTSGLDDIDLDDPDARVHCEAYGTLVACACKERFTPNLALELARLTPMGAFLERQNREAVPMTATAG